MNITEIATAILPSVMEIIGTIAMFMAAKIGIPWGNGVVHRACDPGRNDTV